MDVKELYPSLLADQNAAAIREEFQKQTLGLKDWTGQKQENYLQSVLT